MAARRLKKVLEMRTDSPSMLESLDTLSTVFDPQDNTPESRKLLRSKIEFRGLQLAKEFVEEFGKVQDYIDQVGTNVEQLHEKCGKLLGELRANKAETESFLHSIRDLKDQRTEVESRAKSIDAFLERFKLSKEQSNALEYGPSNNPEQGSLFFSALEQVIEIRGKCQSLMRSQYQSASMEIFESMSKLQERSYDQLFNWLQQESRSLTGSNPEPSETYIRAYRLLQSVPAYFSVVEEALVSARRDAIANQFLTALSQGNPATNSRPIDLHAHDPVRYLGDVLAWVHQTFLFELSFIKSLYQDSGDKRESRKTGKEGGQNRSAILASAVFNGLSDILTHKLNQLLQSSHSLLTIYKLYDLTCFYYETMLPLAGKNAEGNTDSGEANGATNGENASREQNGLNDDGTNDQFASAPDFAETIAQMRAFTLHVLLSSTRVLTSKLLREPPSYPSDLSAAVEVMELVRRLTDILSVQKDSMVQDEKAVAEDTHRLLKEFLEPVLQVCQQSSAGIDPSRAAIYIINNLIAVQVSISRFEHTAGWVQNIASSISDQMDLLVVQHADLVLEQSGVKSKLDALRQHKKLENQTPLSQVPGFDVPSLKKTCHNFYQSLYSLTMPQFNKLSSPRLRGQARRSTSLLIFQAYEELYREVAGEGSGFSDVSDILVHTPEAVKGLLNP